jgi:hypothetical protein
MDEPTLRVIVKIVARTFIPYGSLGALSNTSRAPPAPNVLPCSHLGARSAIHVSMDEDDSVLGVSKLSK